MYKISARYFFSSVMESGFILRVPQIFLTDNLINSGSDKNVLGLRCVGQLDRGEVTVNGTVEDSTIDWGGDWISIGVGVTVTGAMETSLSSMRVGCDDGRKVR